MELSKKDQIREIAEADLEKFIALVHPKRVLGSVHREVIRWWTRPEAKSHQLTLLPRDHQKSALMAYRIAWEITKNPAIRVIYVSSTSTLAVKQAKFIKDILTSDIYRMYWPEMVNEDEAKRTKWSESEFCVDHPLRKEENIRDSTLFTAGLTTSITGLHCDIGVLDDIVVYENAYTDEGREKVARQYSFLASIEATDGKEWVVGTRYHPKDLYDDLMNKQVEIYEPDGTLRETDQLYEVFERAVEDSEMKDGSGQFLWPKQQRGDGKWFGFDQNILAKKKSQYTDKTQFFAQYYNNPNNAESSGVNRDYFQYYDKKHLTRSDGKWYMHGKRLNIFASIDFAFSLSKKADYTSIVVVGIDNNHQYYILDIDRFRTQQISDHFNHILRLHQKWDFRKLRAEVTAAQEVIVKDLKDSYIRPYGLALTIEDYRPQGRQGSKEERINAALQPKYVNRQIWHYEGGNCQVLEDELLLSHPPHDDVKDALASVISICVAPSLTGTANYQANRLIQNISNNRFGGLHG